MSRKSKKEKVEEEEDSSSDDIGPCPYEKILGYQKSGSQIEYFVKLKGEPYKRSEWVKAEELKKYSKQSPSLVRMSKNLAGLNSEPPFYDSRYDKVDRIVAVKGKQYFVQWKNLPFDQNTWEKRVDQASLKLFREREKEPFPKLAGDVGVAPKFQFEMLSKCSIDKVALEPQHLSSLNLMISNFCRGVTTNLLDQMNLDLYLAVIAFVKYCYEEIEDCGPYLIVCSPRNIRKWYKVLRKVKKMTCLMYHGSKESRAVIHQYGFRNGDSLKFHVLLTTNDELQQDFDDLGKVHWRVGVFDDAQRSNNPQSKIFQICEKLVIGHRICVSSTNICKYYPDLLDISEFFLGNKGLLSDNDRSVCERACSRMRSALQGKDRNPCVKLGCQVLYVDCPLSTIQKDVLNTVLNEDIQQLKVGNYISTCQKIVRICNHPFLLFSREYVMGDVNFMECSTKLLVLNALVQDTGDDTVFVVSQFPLMLDLIEDFANMYGITFERITYQATSELESTDKKLVLYSPESGDIPQNLVKQANHIVFFDCYVHEINALFSTDDVQTDTRIYYLACSSCYELRLNEICSMRSTEVVKEEMAKICRAAVMHASMPVDVPPPEQLLADATDTPFRVSADEAIAMELDVLDFWETFEDKSRLCQTSPLEHDHDWTLRDRDQLTRTLFRFGWNQWEKIRTASGLRFNQDLIKTASRAILRFLVDVAQPSPTDTYFDFLQDQHLSDCDTAFLETGVFSDERYRELLTENARLLLRRISALSSLTTEFSPSKRAFLDDLPSPGMPDFWTEDKDYELIVGTLRYGFGCYEHFSLDQDVQSIHVRVSPSKGVGDETVEFRRLNERVVFLGEIIKKSVASEQDTMSDSTYDRASDIDAKWSKEEKKNVTEYLLRMGIDVTDDGERDYNSMLTHCQITDKSPEELRAFIDDFLSNGEVAPNPQSSQLHKNAYRAVNRIAAMDKLREILSKKDDDAIVAFFEQVPKWRLVPEAWSAEHEGYFFKEIMHRGFGSMESILQTEKFNGMFENSKIPIFMTKTESVIKRINTLYDTNHKLLNTQKKEKSSSSKSVSHASPIKAVPFPSYDALAKGDYTLPLQLSPTTELWNLGHIVTDRPKFHTSRYIYPAGYKVSRLFPSTLRPSERVRWFCEIVDTGLDYPVFRIWMEDLPDQVFEGPTPTAPWTLAAKVIAKKLKNKPASVSGPEAFLLATNTVVFLLQNLPGIEQLSEYQMKDFTSIRSKS